LIRFQARECRDFLKRGGIELVGVVDQNRDQTILLQPFCEKRG